MSLEVSRKLGEAHTAKIGKRVSKHMLQQCFASRISRRNHQQSVMQALSVGHLRILGVSQCPFNER